MAFNSLAFLLFFGAVVALFYLLPPRVRWPLLLAASVYFYSAFEPVYVLLLAYAAAVAYAAGLAVAARRGRRGGRAALALGVAGELAVLVAFKYTDFLAASLAPVLRQLPALGAELTLPRLGLLLPAGLSFFTFSCVSYLVDVHRGELPAERNPVRLALYVSFFPKLLAGPIERAGPFLAQLARPARFDPALVAGGLMLMLWGLFKKVVIADRLALFVDAAFKGVAFQSPVTLTVAIYLYAFQIYCDFSGYSDIAIGAARVFGLRLMDNFRRPYLSRSVAEFWSQRWHLSLSHWFRDYLYIPLGGRRVGVPRWYLNQLVVFLVSGLWHGAAWTFVLWGAINGVLQVLQFALAGLRGRLAELLRLPAWIAVPAAMLVTFHLIAFGWIFFRAASVADALTILSRIGSALPQFGPLLANYNWTGDLALSGGLIALLLAVEVVDERRPIEARLSRAPAAVRWGLCYAMMLGLAVIGRWGSTQFVYMQF